MKRVVIRNWKNADFTVYRKWNIGEQTWMKTNGPYYPPATPEELDKKIRQIKIDSQNLSIRIAERMVIADIETDLMIGTVNWYWQSKETQWKSIGIALYNEIYWNQGIGAEALSLWVDYLFTNDKEIVRLDLRTWSGNKGMMKLAGKLGFTEEARFRKARIVAGKYYDSMGYGILREEWAEKIRNKNSTPKIN